MRRKKLTKRGTPCAKSWNDQWIKQVNEREAELDRRICGAATIKEKPCEMNSTHKSGRCPFHGGNDLIGAQKGNYNARKHGLYSRRLQICSDHCATWKVCPYSSQELLKVEIKERPQCVYEQVELSMLMNDSDQQDENIDNHAPHLRRTVALLNVMMGRAAAALSIKTFTESTRSTRDRDALESTKMSAALLAFLRISREHHRYIKELALQTKNYNENEQTNIAEWMGPILKKAEGVLENSLKKTNEAQPT